MNRISSSVVAVVFAISCNPYISAQEFAVYDSALLTIVNDTVVASELPGTVEKVVSAAGYDIRRNRTIAQLDRESFEADVKVAQARLAIAKLEADNDINIRFAEKAREVNEKLLKRSLEARQTYTRSISLTDLDRLELEVEQAKLSREQAELELEIAKHTTKLENEKLDYAKVNLASREIRAPFAGRVEQIFVQPGQWVNAGEPVARIVDLNQLRIKAIFDQKYVLGIHNDNKATFSYSLGDNNYEVEAKVTYVSSEVKNGVFQVWVDIDNNDRKLVPGFQGQLEIELTESR